MDHFVAEGAEGGLPGQGLQQGPRQHNLAEGTPVAVAAKAIHPRRAAHAAIAPAQLHQPLPIRRQAAVKPLPVKLVKQGQQGLERHAGGAVSQTLPQSTQIVS